MQQCHAITALSSPRLFALHLSCGVHKMANFSYSLPQIPTPSAKGLSWSPYVVPAVATYLSLVWLLRFRRRDTMAKKFNYPDKASFSRMTNVDAQAIVQYVAELEFPKIYEMSLQFALFKGSSSQPHLRRS